MRFAFLSSSLLACALAVLPATAAEPLIMHGVYPETYPGFVALVSAPPIGGRPTSLTDCRLTFGQAQELAAAGVFAEAGKVPLPPLRLLVGVDSRGWWSSTGEIVSAVQDLANARVLRTQDEIAIVGYGDKQGEGAKVLLEPTAHRDRVNLATTKAVVGSSGGEDRFLPTLDKLLSFASQPGQALTHRNAVVMILHKLPPPPEQLAGYQNTVLKRRATCMVPVYVLCPDGAKNAPAYLASFCRKTGGDLIPIAKPNRTTYGEQLRQIPARLRKTQYCARFQIPTPDARLLSHVGRMTATAVDHNGGSHAVSSSLAFEVDRDTALRYALAQAEDRFARLQPTVVAALAQPRQLEEMFAQRQCDALLKAADESLGVFPKVEAECEQFLGELQAIGSPRAETVGAWIPLLQNARRSIAGTRAKCDLLVRFRNGFEGEEHTADLLRSIADSADYSNAERASAGFQLAATLDGQSGAIDRYRTSAALFAVVPEPGSFLAVQHVHAQVVLGNPDAVFTHALPLLERNLPDSERRSVQEDLIRAFRLLQQKGGTEALVQRLRKLTGGLPPEILPALREMLRDSMVADVKALTAGGQHAGALKFCAACTKSPELGVSERQDMRKLLATTAKAAIAAAVKAGEHEKAVALCHEYAHSPELVPEERQEMCELLAKTVLAHIAWTLEHKQYEKVIALCQTALAKSPLDDVTKAKVGAMHDTAFLRRLGSAVDAEKKAGDYAKATRLCDEALREELPSGDTKRRIAALRNGVVVEYAEKALGTATDAAGQQTLAKYCLDAVARGDSGYTDTQVAKLMMVGGVATYRLGDWNRGLALVNTAVRKDASLKKTADKLIAEAKQGVRK